MYQDSYYIDQSLKFDKDGGAVNFDHPDALDFKLMSEHLKKLKEGHDVEIPIYDFATHTRSKEVQNFKSKIVSQRLDQLKQSLETNLVTLNNTFEKFDKDNKTVKTKDEKGIEEEEEYCVICQESFNENHF